ncbi:hypothetical protein [Ruminiclostridium josui]|uniref:hypothetical protein n=1 Tax=Ruminiclostridium josui TaxID=1499 RepID=UPI0009E8F735|nr:hypothetical protein [Ruminiclostridium josui]
MKDYQLKDEILSSWRRCIENNLLPQQNVPIFNYEVKEIKKMLDKNKIFISVFEEALDNIESENIDKCLFYIIRC